MHDPIRYAESILKTATGVTSPDPRIPEVVQVGRYQLESLARCVLDQAEQIALLQSALDSWARPCG